jgi:hypothetical protein
VSLFRAQRQLLWFQTHLGVLLSVRRLLEPRTPPRRTQAPSRSATVLRCLLQSRRRREVASAGRSAPRPTRRQGGGFPCRKEGRSSARCLIEPVGPRLELKARSDSRSGPLLPDAPGGSQDAHSRRPQSSRDGVTDRSRRHTDRVLNTVSSERARYLLHPRRSFQDRRRSVLLRGWRGPEDGRCVGCCRLSS